MNEIKCPHCSTAFTVDESGYSAILSQVRDSEFNRQLNERMQEAGKERELAVNLAKSQAANDTQTIVAGKDAELAELRAKLSAAGDSTTNAVLQATTEKDAEIQSLKILMESEQKNKDLAVSEAVAKAERDRGVLEAKLAQSEKEKNAATALLQSQLQNDHTRELASKDDEIKSLQAKLHSLDLEQQLKLTQSLNTIEKERDELKAEVQRKDLEISLTEKTLRGSFELQLKDRDEQIERLKDLKAKRSTKMLGETLEQHCEIEFNKIRATAFPRAYFEKDNDSSSGSKGDFIFRESDLDETEIVSIMFEMKNEADTTATKSKNEDFLKELDKDRREKGCEYAILVTMLESDNELYNSGIVDVSHRYPKMYVVRPQFFIPIITMLRNAALNTLKYKSELAIVKAQNIDIENFEGKLFQFKDSISRNYELASKHYTSAIEEIDKSIKHLEKTKQALLGADNNLRIANNKAQDVTIKSLTKGNPTLAAEFSTLESKRSSEDKGTK